MNLFSKAVKEEYPISSEISAIDILGFNGSITWVEISGKGSRIVVEKQAQGFNVAALRDVLQNLVVEDHSANEKVVLKATQSERPFGVSSVQTRFIVYASPEQIREFKAQTSNGSIKIEVPFTGKLQLTSGNGAIRIESGAGEVNLRTSNGSIGFGQLKLENSSSMRTSNGSISGGLELPTHGEYLFSTSNGSVKLRLPHDAPGSFRVRTSNGRVKFSLGEDQITGKKDLLIQRGHSPAVNISSSNGSITVEDYISS